MPCPCFSFNTAVGPKKLFIVPSNAAKVIIFLSSMAIKFVTGMVLKEISN